MGILRSCWQTRNRVEYPSTAWKSHGVYDEKRGDECIAPFASCYVRRECYFAFFFTQSVPTDFGRVIGVPTARLMMNWEHIPIAREIENSTV
jgi:hypothetical protein